MKKILVFVLFLSFNYLVKGQNINYNDVAVIINQNSAASVTIGTYFQDQRNIPDENMITINCTTNETADSAEFFSIVNQVSNYLIDNGLENTINYIVTTKGVPLVYQPGDCDSIYFYKCKAVDSELTLIVNHADEIGSVQTFYNPYFNENNIFDGNEYDIYLVTRLDGYTVDDVLNLIDRSGPEQPIKKQESNFIFDLSYVYDTTVARLFDKVLERGYEYVISNGWPGIHNADPDVFIQNETNVTGYYNYNWEPSDKVLNFEWKNGSIAVLALGTSAFTFDEDENVFNELILANLIHEGVTGCSGTVVPYFFSSGTIFPDSLFKRYLPSKENDPGFNLAESFYMSIQMLASSRIVVGDPKTSLRFSTSGINKNYSSIYSLNVYPNPFSRSTTIAYFLPESSLVTLSIFNHFGELIHQVRDHQEKGRQKLNWDAEGLPAGVYYLRLENGVRSTTGKLILVD